MYIIIISLIAHRRSERPRAYIIARKQLQLIPDIYCMINITRGRYRDELRREISNTGRPKYSLDPLKDIRLILSLFRARDYVACRKFSCTGNNASVYQFKCIPACNRAKKLASDRAPLNVPAQYFACVLPLLRATCNDAN